MNNINQVLIVDDNREDQTVYQRYIGKSFGDKIHILIMEKGAPALNYLHNNKIDCILLDYQLPDMTGIDFLHQIKEFYSDVPIIMLTGTGNEKIAVEALKLGAYDYLIKGELQPEVLYKAIANAVQTSNLKKRIEEKEEEIKYLAYFDYLTGIPNRAQFEEKMRQMLDHAQKTQQSFAVLLIDLDRFKVVNDKHGHETGDLLLKQVVKLFQKCLRESDILARLGGDEFAIIVDNLPKPENVSHIANKLIHALAEPLLINENRIRISPSIGIAHYPQCGETISKLISNADIALYQAKNEGKNTYRYFTEQLSQLSRQQLDIENALHEALIEDNFFLLYQPIINLDNNSLFGMEVLLRSANPFLNNIHIKKIIDVANEIGLIVPLGYWIIEHAFQQYNQWKRRNVQHFKLSINLSARQLAHGVWFEKISSLIDEYQIDPQNLIFELTESDVLLDLDNANDQLSLLTKLGCEIFVDDFGTGYSSLNFIRKLPISGLKIDKSFMYNIDEDNMNAKLMHSMILLGNNLDLALIIEGIETKSQYDFISKYPNVKGQGFYFAHPLTANEMEKFVFP